MASELHPRMSPDPCASPTLPCLSVLKICTHTPRKPSASIANRGLRTEAERTLSTADAIVCKLFSPSSTGADGDEQFEKFLPGVEDLDGDEKNVWVPVRDSTLEDKHQQLKEMLAKEDMEISKLENQVISADDPDTRAGLVDALNRRNERQKEFKKMVDGLEPVKPRPAKNQKTGTKRPPTRTVEERNQDQMKKDAIKLAGLRSVQAAKLHKTNSVSLAKAEESYKGANVKEKQALEALMTTRVMHNKSKIELQNAQFELKVLNEPTKRFEPPQTDDPAKAALKGVLENKLDQMKEHSFSGNEPLMEQALKEWLKTTFGKDED